MKASTACIATGPGAAWNNSVDASSARLAAEAWQPDLIYKTGGSMFDRLPEVKDRQDR